MSAIRLVAPTLAVGIFLVGCTEPPTITESPSFNMGNAPEFSGIVTRGETPLAVSWFDAKAGTRVVIGADVFEACAGNFNFDLVHFKNVNLPNDRPLVQQLKGEDMQTTVYPFTAFDCGLFTTVTPLASGASDLVNTDNDLFGAQPEDNNANAWGFRAHGKLVRPSGASAVFSGHVNLRVNNSQGFKANSKITLN